MVRFINCFEVPPGREDDFLEMFATVNAHMTGQPGYLGHRLHRSLAPDAPYRFVNYVEWESADAWRAAHGQEFRELVSRPDWAFFTSVPALYEVIDERGHIMNGGMQ